MQIELICNTDDSALFSNVSVNSRAQKKRVKEVPAHDGHAVIVGGGPSLTEFLPTIRKRQELGQKVFALNGSARFLNANGIIPTIRSFLTLGLRMSR